MALAIRNKIKMLAERFQCEPSDIPLRWMQACGLDLQEALNEIREMIEEEKSADH